MKLPIYLDYSATTPVDLRVAEKMMKFLTIDGVFGNPNSRFHRYGWQAEEAVDIARNQIANLIGADSREIIFTSGATESNNLALKGSANVNSIRGRNIITAVTEHKAVIDTCKYLEQKGFVITWLVPPKNGIINPQQLSNALRDDTILVSLMHVNNETGVIQDIATFGEICHAHGAILHVDATQSVGKLPINLNLLKVDLMSFSGHKIYGPKGIGVLFIRRNPKVKIEPEIHGGGHERGIRSGTLPVHQIVGMGEACYIAKKLLDSEMPRIQVLRDQLWQKIQHIGGVSINGDLRQSVANILNVSFHDIDGESLIMSLKDLAVSTGSTCNSISLEPSYVIRAMKLNDVFNHGVIRFSLGRFTTSEEINYAVHQICNTIKYLR